MLATMDTVLEPDYTTALPEAPDAVAHQQFQRLQTPSVVE